MTEHSRSGPRRGLADSRDYPHGRVVRVIVESSTDDLVVMKTGSNPVAVTAIDREALVLGQLRHPNVVELLRTERGDDSATLVTAFAGRTTLAQVSPVDVPSVARLGVSLLTVVEELHDLGWVHGRLRADHCIVGADGRLTLCALGAAHRAPRGDERFAQEARDAVALVAALADRLAEPARRSDRRRLAELRRVLAGSDPVAIRRSLVRLAGPAPVRPQVDTRRPTFGTSADTPTAPSNNRRTLAVATDQTTVPPRNRPATRWRGALASSALLAGFLGVIALLRWLGGELTNPLAVQGVHRATDLPVPLVLSLQVLRWAAVLACLYGVALSAAALAAVLTRRPDVARVAVAMAPRRLRHVMVLVIGLGLASSAVPPGAAPTVGRSATTTTAPTTTTTPTATTTTTTPPPVIARVATPTAATPSDAQPQLPRLWVIEHGDHLWSVASATLAEHLGRQPLDSEVDPYWRAVVEMNRESLVDPHTPDLVFAGQVIELPPLD
ncbi:MAG: hypothetical protein U0Q22_03895 [Acidimicrobiales bacterium]